MVQYELSGALGLSEMIDKLINATWKSEKLTGMHQLIQLQTEQVLLTYLLSSSVDENLSFAARGIVQKALADLKSFIEEKRKPFPTPPIWRI